MSLTIPCIADGYYDCPECEQLKYFYDLVLIHNKFDKLNQDQYQEILDIMDEKNFVNIINEIYKNNHSCIAFSFTNMRLEVIDFLRHNNKIIIQKQFDENSNVFNALEILYTLFNEFYNNIKSTQKAIQKVNNWIQKNDPEEHLVFMDLDIHTLPELPSNLRVLICSLVPITQLPNLPQTLEALNLIACDYLTTLPNLPNSLLRIRIAGVPITTLPLLPPNLKMLACIRTALTTLPPLPDSLWDICCYNSPNLFFKHKKSLTSAQYKDMWNTYNQTFLE